MGTQEQAFNAVKQLLVSIAALTTLLVSFDAAGQDKKKSYWQLKREKMELINSSRPRRLDEPLREDNVSDEEVRAIQAVTIEIYPGALVNISGVTAGCPCEDGPRCDSQVWVVAYQDGQNDGLLLSRIDGNWGIGPVQRWWHQYQRISDTISEVLSGRAPDRSEQYRALLERRNELEEYFPFCANGDSST